MSGTKDGGKIAAKTNKEKYGDDFYRKIGAAGGKVGRTGGFWHRKYVLCDEGFIKNAGAKGGRISRRTK